MKGDVFRNPVQSNLIYQGSLVTNLIDLWINRDSMDVTVRRRNHWTHRVAGRPCSLLL